MRHVVHMLLALGLALSACPAVAQMDTAWVRSLSGPVAGLHIGHAIGSLPDGGAVVAGQVLTPSNGTDMVITRYSPGGDVLWTNYYDGPAHGDDAARCICTKSDGSVYVAGEMQYEPYMCHVIAIKYNPDGGLAWTRVLDSARGLYGRDSVAAMCFDREGNIILTGTYLSPSWGSVVAVFLTKLDTAGLVAWDQKFLPRFYAHATASALCVSADNNIYLAGSVIATDYVNSSWAYLLARFLPTGYCQWHREYDAIWGGTDRAKALTVDDKGFIYITGTSEGEDGTEDYLTLKYDTAGTELVARRFYGWAHGADRAVGVGVDPSGAIYVGGQSRGFSSLEDFHVIKYDTVFWPVWERRYTGPGFSVEIPSAFHVDSLGRTIIVGASGQTPASWEYAAVSFDSTGRQLWERRYGAGDGTPDSATAFSLDDAGNIFVMGKGNTGTADEAITTVKYAPCSPLPPPDVAPVTSNSAPCFGEQYTVSWHPVAGASGYDLYENEVYVSTVTDTSFVRVHESGTYTYTVHTVHPACGRSAPSPVGATTAVLSCGCHTDPACDGTSDILDVTSVINEAFRGIHGVRDATCPHISRSDIDCDCEVTVIDVIHMINVAFRGSPIATQFCNACVSPCP